ncbi:hypothetical protein ACFJIV_02165 [Mucilaginibacter sp. UC70_90]
MKKNGKFTNTTFKFCMIQRFFTCGLFASLLTFSCFRVQAQDTWILKADQVNGRYYGETVANGAVGIVTSNSPFKIQDIVLAGAYDLYGRGGVDNFLRNFNLLNMNFRIDGGLDVSRDDATAKHAQWFFYHHFQ